MCFQLRIPIFTTFPYCHRYSLSIDCMALIKSRVSPPAHATHTCRTLGLLHGGNTITARGTRARAHTHMPYSTPLSITSDRTMQGGSQSRLETHTTYRNSPWSCTVCMVFSCSEFKFHGIQKIHHEAVRGKSRKWKVQLVTCIGKPLNLSNDDEST